MTRKSGEEAVPPRVVRKGREVPFLDHAVDFVAFHALTKYQVSAAWGER